MQARKLVLVTALTLLIGGVVGVPAAGASQVRYMLLMTMSSSADRAWSQDHGDQGWWWEVWHESTTYVARSARPFLVTRRADGRTFAFSSKVAGSMSHVGSGTQGWWGYPGPQTCLETRRQWSPTGLPVQGSVSLTNRLIEAFVHYGYRSDPIKRDIKTVCEPPEYSRSFRGPGSEDTPLGWYVRADQLRKHFGRAFTITEERNGPSVTVLGRQRNRLTLRFTPVAPAKEEEQPERQRWQVDVRGTDKWRWGVLTGLRAGVDVDWLHRTTLTLKDGKIVSATGKVSLLNVRPYSEPLGVFTVTPTKKQTWPEYTLPSATKAKGSNRVTLMTYDRRVRSSSEYLLRWKMTLAGPQALDIIRKARLPNPDGLYGDLAKRGSVIDSVSPFVPDPARLVFLLQEKTQPRPTELFDKRVTCPKQLSEQACFLNRGGQTVTVTKLR